MASRVTPCVPLASILRFAGPQGARDASETTRSTMTRQTRKSSPTLTPHPQRMIPGVSGSPASRSQSLLMSPLEPQLATRPGLLHTPQVRRPPPPARLRRTFPTGRKPCLRGGGRTKRGKKRSKKREILVLFQAQHYIPPMSISPTIMMLDSLHGALPQTSVPPVHTLT